MITMALRVAGALVCLAVASLLVLLAIDAHTWGSRLPADDLRYTHDASASGLWKPRQLAPLGLSRSVLGIDDDLAYRHALRDFRLGRATEPIQSSTTTTHRIQAEIELTDFAASKADAQRRSQAENLLGVLGFGLATQDTSQRNAFFNDAIDAFRRAIILNPLNDDAAFNLEYALDQERGGDQPAAGSNDFGFHKGAGFKPPGHGF